MRSVRSVGGNRWELRAPIQQDVRADVFRFAVAQQLTLVEMHKEILSVEDVFQELTK